MDPSFEQASAFLDQAILFYTNGQIEQAAQFMADAATMLHELQFPSPAATLEMEDFQPVMTDPAAAIAPELLLAMNGPPAEPPVEQPVAIESAGKSSFAVAA